MTNIKVAFQNAQKFTFTYCS